MKIFIAGSIGITTLDKKVTEHLDSIVTKELDILVGDAAGADLAVQQRLFALNYKKVVVHCINSPRNNVGSWPVQSIPVARKRLTRDDFMKKDLAMAHDADYGFMIWDCRSSGTLNNVLNLLSIGKASLVFCAKPESFLRVSCMEELDRLVQIPTSKDLETIEKKVRLSARRAELSRRIAYDSPAVAFSVGEPQLDLFVGDES